MSFRHLVLALSGWGAAAFAALPPATFARVFVVTVFLLVCPGLAAVRWVRRPGATRAPNHAAALEPGVLAVVLSLTLSTLVAEALFLAGVFTVDRAMLVLAALTSVLALVPLPGGRGRAARRQRERRAKTAGSPR